MNSETGPGKERVDAARTAKEKGRVSIGSTGPKRSNKLHVGFADAVSGVYGMGSYAPASANESSAARAWGVEAKKPQRSCEIGSTICVRGQQERKGLALLALRGDEGKLFKDRYSDTTR